MSAADVLSLQSEHRIANSRAVSVPRTSQPTWKKASGEATSQYAEDSLKKMEDLSGIRPSHKQVEQHRRLKAKQYFDELRELLPGSRDNRCDRNRILVSAIEMIKSLKGMERGNRQSLDFMDEEGNDEEGKDDLMFEMQDLGEGGSKLSHNEVEQRRRMLARKLFEELRHLLPESGKSDKNTILLNAIQLIRNLNAAQAAAPTTSSCSSSPESAAAITPPELSPSPLSVSQAVTSISSSLGTTASLSSSPADVTAAACDFMGALQATGKEVEGEEEGERRTRKRSPTDEGASPLPGIKQILAMSQEATAEEAEDASSSLASDGGHRKRRMVGTMRAERGGLEEEGSWGLTARPDRSLSLEEEEQAFAALSLLSECAERFSLPSTPLAR